MKDTRIDGSDVGAGRHEGGSTQRELNCPHCHRTFAFRPNKRFCGPTCKYKYWQAHKHQRAHIIRNENDLWDLFEEAKDKYHKLKAKLDWVANEMLSVEADIAAIKANIVDTKWNLQEIEITIEEFEDDTSDVDYLELIGGR